jgi:phage shock protein PspC (stress-responsive transcriptional regulator)
MKPVQKVSIGGYAFTLEEDAYKTISDYLDELGGYYASRQGGSEIMEGIEERMAELLLEKQGSAGVVDLETVHRIIGVLGRPEAIEEESDVEGNGNQNPADASPKPESSSEETSGGRDNPKVKRRLYRDLEHKMLGGVCSGLGVYTKVDPIVYRLIFVVFTLFDFIHIFRVLPRPWGWASVHLNLLFPLIYLILWIVIPAARTAEHRWAMRGETGSVDDIERKVGNGFQEIGAAVGKLGHQTGEVIREAGSSPIGRVLGRIFVICVGTLLLVIGVALVIGGLGYYEGVFDLGMSRSYLWSQINEEWPMVADFLSKPLSWILLLLVVGLPAIGMIYGGIMLLFDLKAPNWHPGLVIFVSWLIALVAFSVLVALAAVSGTLSWP